MITALDDRGVAASAAFAGCVRAAGASHAAAALSSVQRESAARSGSEAPRPLRVSRASTAGLPWLGRPPCGTGDVQFFGRSPRPLRECKESRKNIALPVRVTQYFS